MADANIEIKYLQKMFNPYVMNFKNNKWVKKIVFKMHRCSHRNQTFKGKCSIPSRCTRKTTNWEETNIPKAVADTNIENKHLQKNVQSLRAELEKINMNQESNWKN